MRHPRLLIVEDDFALCDLLVATFSNITNSIEVRQTAADASAHIATGQVDAATIDIRLPDGSGLDLAKALRMRSPHAAILLVTGVAEEEVLVDGLDMGADDYVIKPVRPEELRARMKAILRRRGAYLRDAPGFDVPVVGTVDARDGAPEARDGVFDGRAVRK